MNIFEKYGVKEVANFTLRKIKDDGSAGAPVLFLDTLKVSTIEQTAEQTSARGGWGNPELIIWDYGKEINVNLEDALFSPKSLAVMFGDGSLTNLTTVSKTVPFTGVTVPTTWKDRNGEEHSIVNPTLYDAASGEVILSNALTADGNYFAVFSMTVKGSTVTISGDTYPGTYYAEGETFARSAITGNDTYFRIEIPKCKMGAENTITLEAEGDPSVFNMPLRVLRPDDGDMIRLSMFDMDDAPTGPDEVDYTATGAITEIDPVTVTWDGSSKKFTVPAGITQFTFKDGSINKKGVKTGSTWNITTVVS